MKIKITPGTITILNTIVILLLIIAIFTMYAEIYHIKKEGGHCLNNPMVWAEKYIFEEKGLIVDCSCKQLNFYIPDLNLTNITGSGK